MDYYNFLTWLSLKIIAGIYFDMNRMKKSNALALTYQLSFLIALSSSMMITIKLDKNVSYGIYYI